MYLIRYFQVVKREDCQIKPLVSWLERALWLVHLARRSSLFGSPISKVCFDRQNVFSRRILNRLKGRPAPKRFHVLFSSRQQTSTQCQPVFNPFVQSAPSNPPGNFPGNATNTNNRMLIIRKILVLFSIALIKFIHSFNIDIEQSKPLVRTFYAETMGIKRTFWTFDPSKSSFNWKPIKCA